MTSPMVRVDKSMERLLQDGKKKSGMSQVKLSKLIARDTKLDRILGRNRGQITEIAALLVALFATALLVLVIWVVSDGMAGAMRDAGLNTTSDIEAGIQGIETVGKSGDTWVSGVLVGFTLLILAIAALLPTSSIFMVFYLIGVLLLWMLSPILSNAYQSITASGTMATVASDLSVTSTIMLNLPTYMTVIVMMLLIVLYGKRRFLG